MTRAALVLVALALLPTSAVGQTPSTPRLLADVFRDHAVLQRDQPISVWGKAERGDSISISLGGAKAAVRAAASGDWVATMPAMSAGGPHSLAVQTKRGQTQTVSDILIGDVWLCSGQSNMELPVTRTLNSANEIAQSSNESIRLLTVAHAYSAVPLDRFEHPVAWSVASPQTVRDFSGTCYYFARELQKTARVPMGLIVAAWGGSAIEAWIGETGLRAAGGLDESLDALQLYVRDRTAANKRFGAMWETWWRSRGASTSRPWQQGATASEWRSVPEPFRDWKTWGVPELVGHLGMLWFRRTIRLTPQQSAQAATLSLGAIDEVDETWVNGAPIGNTFGWGTERTYELPKGTLREGDNLVVVNVLNTWGAGGMLGPATRLALRFADGTSIPLAGDWSYQVVPLSLGRPPRAPWEAIAGLSTLHNAMIAPLGRLRLRGVAWYQGETNSDTPEQAAAYESLLTSLMADWRGRFGAGIAFLVVQLPNFGDVVTAPVASGWATVREAQRRAVAKDSRAALAITIDVGDRNELHPPNKQEVGRRLARAARSVAYGEPIAPSGPRVVGARREATGVVVTFRDVEGALVTHSASQAIGFELCGADQASCRFVSGAVRGDRVALDTGSTRDATRVRFCWGAAPVCNLYDRSGLPVGPFEVEIQ